VTPFARLPAPELWAAKEKQWLSGEVDWTRVDPLAWETKGRSLRELFHQHCRSESEPLLCAYCDGDLRVTSGDTIDHFVPKAEFPELRLSWHNLFPACHLCNSRYKREQWSCALVRPDTDPVDAWFDVDLETGAVRASPEIEDATIRARIRLTIVVLRLNTPDRCKARHDVVRACRNAWKREASTREHDRPTVHERAMQGPYRFVARRFLDAVPASAPNP
jgi:uncharacterized protein (TIGR02646 family)